MFWRININYNKKIVAKEYLQNHIFPIPHLCLLLKNLRHLDNFQQPRQWRLHIYPIKTNLSYISKKIWARNNYYLFWDTLYKKGDDQWKITFDGRQSVKIPFRWVLICVFLGKALGVSSSAQHCVQTVENCILTCLTLWFFLVGQTVPFLCVISDSPTCRYLYTEHGAILLS